MDIKEKIEEIVEKVKNDKTLMSRFQKEPIKVVEQLIGIDLPDDQLQNVVDAVKAKMDMDKIGGFLGGLFGKK